MTRLMHRATQSHEWEFFRTPKMSRRAFLRTLVGSTAGLLAGCRFEAARDVSPSVPVLGEPIGNADLDTRIVQAYRYLETEMDRWSQRTVVYDDLDSGGAGFFPSGWMGDIEDLRLDLGVTDNPAAGTTCIRATYTPRGSQRWAGIYWLYPNNPDGNWGYLRGRDLTGATRLQGWIRGEKGGEIVELKIGGVNRPPHNNPSIAHQDSLGPLGIRMSLSPDWQRFEIPIPHGTPLDNVIGGFAFVVSAPYNPDGSVVYLDEITYDDAEPQRLRLIRSYTPTADPNDRAIRNAAFLYDNALAVLAFLARGDDEGRRRAAILADSLVWAQKHDRAYHDGRWRNAYSSGPLQDPATDSARLPGWYDPTRKRWLEDRYAVSSDTGNTGWAMIALLSAHDALSSGGRDSPYLAAASRAGEWIEAHCRAGDALGGYTGGFEGWERNETSTGPAKLEWRSTEHNLDLYAAFSRVADVTGHNAWRQRAAHARGFVLNMWNQDGPFFWAGVRDRRGTLNRDAVPADAQTWALLAMGHDSEFRRVVGWSGSTAVPSCIGWVEMTVRVANIPECPGVSGYRFSNQGSGVWFEGSAHLAAAYRYIRDDQRAESVVNEIIRANPIRPPAEDNGREAGLPPSVGGIEAACPDPAATGFIKEFAPGVVGPWTYPKRPHVGATAWFLLAARGANPFWLNRAPSVSTD